VWNKDRFLLTSGHQLAWNVEYGGGIVCGEPIRGTWGSRGRDEVTDRGAEGLGLYYLYPDVAFGFILL